AAVAERHVNILGIFDDRLARNPQAIAGVPVLGDVQSLLGHKITPYVDQIVVALDTSAKARVKTIIEKLRSLPNEVSLFVDMDNDNAAKAAWSRVADIPLARVSGISEDDRKAMMKRAEDLIIGLLALIIFTPLMLVVAVLIKLDSPGPVFFRQRRHGFNNEAIRVWKFRSMYTHLTDHTAAQQVTKGDPRVTRIGRFIRKTSIDELPQLFNVIKGEMSLVGPRPHAIGMKTGPDESARLVAEYAWRHRMKPGVTGWAAIKGSRGPLDNAADVRRRIGLDVEYIERHSIWFDLYIMAMTIPCLLGDAKVVR
ncbi:MAG TPA: exopolysaccharide biosynthesis polyprenyl glycosylphosphotransferase, partial [Asticcacaulis sp.]|nr:exopolysaccharide biosynthesis polyprenyl glycosylphosphotransferase [Asticcacaulis sp.]